jgi:hypothetical protein
MQGSGTLLDASDAWWKLGTKADESLDIIYVHLDMAREWLDFCTRRWPVWKTMWLEMSHGVPELDDPEAEHNDYLEYKRSWTSRWNAVDRALTELRSLVELMDSHLEVDSHFTLTMWNNRLREIFEWWPSTWIQQWFATLQSHEVHWIRSVKDAAASCQSAALESHYENVRYDWVHKRYRQKCTSRSPDEGEMDPTRVEALWMDYHMSRNTIELPKEFQAASRKQWKWIYTQQVNWKKFYESRHRHFQILHAHCETQLRKTRWATLLLWSLLVPPRDWSTLCTIEAMNAQCALWNRQANVWKPPMDSI